MLTYCRRQICFWLCNAYIVACVTSSVVVFFWQDYVHRYLSWLRSYIIPTYLLSMPICVLEYIHKKKSFFPDSNYSPTEIGSPPCCRNTENPERKWFSSICRRIWTSHCNWRYTMVLQIEKPCNIIWNKDRNNILGVSLFLHRQDFRLFWSYCI